MRAPALPYARRRRDHRLPADSYLRSPDPTGQSRRPQRESEFGERQRARSREDNGVAPEKGSDDSTGGGLRTAGRKLANRAPAPNPCSGKDVAEERRRCPRERLRMIALRAE